MWRFATTLLIVAFACWYAADGHMVFFDFDPHGSTLFASWAGVMRTALGAAILVGCAVFYSDRGEASPARTRGWQDLCVVFVLAVAFAWCGLVTVIRLVLMILPTA